MKLLFTSSLFSLGFLATVVDSFGSAADCQVNAVAGYQNCKSELYVNAPGADVLWCKTELDCNKVFLPSSSGNDSRPTPEVVREEEESVSVDMEVSGVQEAVSSSTMLTASTSAAVVATVSAMMVLC